MDYFAELEGQEATVAMDVDDVDPLEIFGEGVLAVDNRLADSDFFNSFEDDFDDSDINWFIQPSLVLLHILSYVGDWCNYLWMDKLLAYALKLLMNSVVRQTHYSY